MSKGIRERGPPDFLAGDLAGPSPSFHLLLAVPGRFRRRTGRGRCGSLGGQGGVGDNELGPHEVCRSLAVGFLEVTPGTPSNVCRLPQVWELVILAEMQAPTLMPLA